MCIPQEAQWIKSNTTKKIESCSRTISFDQFISLKLHTSVLPSVKPLPWGPIRTISYTIFLSNSSDIAFASFIIGIIWIKSSWRIISSEWKKNWLFGFKKEHKKLKSNLINAQFNRECCKIFKLQTMKRKRGIFIRAFSLLFKGLKMGFKLGVSFRVKIWVWVKFNSELITKQIKISGSN